MPFPQKSASSGCNASCGSATPAVSAALAAASCSSILAFSEDKRSISCCKIWFMFATISAALSSAIGWPPRYSSSSRSFGVSPESSFGITSTRRSMISPASCSARAFADSSLRCFASSSAVSAARLVFSQSASTSSILICPVTCGSVAPLSGTYMLICPS